MSGYKSFAVAGVGHIGTFFVDELLQLKKAGVINSVSALTRLGSNNTIPDGAQAVDVDYADPAALKAALRGVDIVISALGGAALQTQLPLAEAAKSAGVKLFVPSEFGPPTTGDHGPGPLRQKFDLHAALENLGLPYTLFYTGPWPDYCFIPYLGWDLENGQVTIGGEGNTPISFTSRADLSRFIVHVLTAVPAERLANGTFRVEGERTTLNEITATYQAKSGKTLKITHRPQAELKAALEANPNDFSSYLMLLWDQGYGIVGKPEELDNGLLGEWRPKKVLDVLL